MFKALWVLILNLFLNLAIAREVVVVDFDETYSEGNFPSSVDVYETIVIKKSGEYDFKNVLHVWKGQDWDCVADKEHGPQILRVEASNVTIKNFAYVGDGKTRGSHGLGDPVRIATCAKGQGNKCDPGPDNVTLDGLYGHACEDLLTTGRGVTRLTVKNSHLFSNPDPSSWDKTFQINFGKDLHITGNTFWGGNYCIRILQGVEALITNNFFNGCRDAVKMGSADGTFANLVNEDAKIFFNLNTLESVKNPVVCDGKRISSKDGHYVCKYKPL